MPGAAIGALLGAVFSSTIIGWGLAATWLGAVMIGASIGSLFDAQEIDLGSSTPNYAFGQLSNTKSQLLPVPIVYGRCRVGGNVFMQTFYDDSMQKMDMFVGVSEGPIQSIKSVYANDIVLIDENGDVVHELADSSINLHLGAPDQVADSRDPGGNAYPNTAYIALTLKAQDGLSGNPVISSIVEGRKVWTPSGTVFSRNPAWIVYDFLTNTRYGVGIPTEYIDLDSFTAAATYCDHPIDGEPRFTLDYIIDVQRPAVDHLQAMMGCFRGYFLARDKIELHVEQAGSVYKALGPDNFVKDSFTWWQKSGDDSPNRIVIEWIDPNNHYEQSSAPFEWTEDIAARGVYEKSISLLGVTRPEQVGRLGNYLLETAKRVQNFCAFQVSLKDADIEAGEVISITHQDFTGWSAKPFRVLKVQDEGQTGNVTITCAEYDAAIYADDALTVDLPVIETPPVTTDDVYSLALEDVGFLDDGTWVPVIRASWQNPSDYTPSALNVRWRYEGETDWNLSLNSTRLITQARIEGLKSGETVEVWVNCVRPDTGKETTGKTTSMVVGKDVTPPEACTGLAATGWFGSIILEWTNPADKDLNYVELWENAVDNRAGAVKIADVKGAGFTRYLGSFQGRYYWVRGVDFSGNIGPWNAEAGVYGNSDQETHQDFVDLLLEENPYLNEAIDTVVASVTLTQDEEELIAQGLVDAMLNDQENKDETRERSRAALAIASTELYAHIDDGLNAEAGQRTLLAAQVAGNTTAIQTESVARANADSAMASQITTLSTTVGNNTSAIQTIDSSVDGIQSKHAVKIDTNGYVTGYELIGTGASSSMVFHVDNFLIGKPGATNDYPFALGTVDGVTRISMKNVFIQDASIKTLKIENNAVTTYVFVTGGKTSSWGTLYGRGTPTWRDLPANNSVTVTEVVSDRPAMITFSVNWFSAEDYSGTSFRVLANTSPSISGATVIWSKNVGGGDQINMSYTEQFQWIPSSSGTWYLYIQWLLGSGGDHDSKWNTYIRSHSLSLFHMKR